MSPIRVIDVVGPVCVDPEDGSLLCQQALAALTSGAGVVLDFSGVRTLTTSFLTTAVACLFARFPVDAIETRVKWVGLDAVDERLLRLVLARAARFYSATPKQQEDLTSAFRRAIEGYD